MRRSSIAAAALAAALLSCGEPPAPVAPAPPSATLEKPGDPPPTRADGRLPVTARPVSYALDLTIDPREARFSGTARITVDVPEKTFHVVLHGRDLVVTRAFAGGKDAANPAEVTARVANGGQHAEELVLTFARPLAPGQTPITIEYTAAFGDSLAGLYRVQDGGAWYAFTQFEPADARRMFPCFDEPGFKVPFDVSVTAPTGMIAVGNAPEASRTPNGAWTTFKFATTKPLPTYLVALAVGTLDVRQGPTSPVPIRLIATKGKAELGALAIDATANLVRALADYFGVPYAYPKLDVVAVPEFAAGAMENAGLLTFREELLLLDPRHASTRSRRSMALVVAHELAHQWFGDLVTAEWWNDLWLNEAMATWMESRAVDTWQPRFGASLDDLNDTQHVMDLDALTTARAIRQPVTTTGEAEEAFDGLTYRKGAALLAMTEKWLGRDVFQAGLRDYLQTNAFKNARAESLLTALDKASRKDVSAMAGSFLDRPGVPVVTAHLACEQGSRWNVEMRLEPWRALGSRAEASQQGWTIPVCVRAAGQAAPACTVIAAGAPSLVAGRGACPAWIHPNDGSVGYYRWALAPGELMALARAYDSLDAPSRLGLVSNAWAMVRAGSLPPEQLVKLLPMFDKENDRRVLDEIVVTLAQANDALVDDESRAAFRAFVAARLGRHKKALGWAPKDGDTTDDDRALLRRTIVFAMADLAEDPATLREADPLAQAWLKDPASIDGDTAQLAVEIASRKAGPERFDALRAALKRAKTPQDRLIALRALGGFDDPALLEKALDLSLTDEVRVADLRYVFGAAAARRASRPVYVKWLTKNWDKARAKLAGALAGRLVGVAGLVCTRAERDEMEAFLTPRAASIEGSARPLAESLEAASLCAELRARDSASFGKALRGK